MANLCTVPAVSRREIYIILQISELRGRVCRINPSNKQNSYPLHRADARKGSQVMGYEHQQDAHDLRPAQLTPRAGAVAVC